MTLVSITFSGYIVGDVVFIVGSVTGKLGGSALIAERLIFFVSFCLFFSFFFNDDMGWRCDDVFTID